MNNHVDVLVIGAGQAGLAIGYYLKQTNLTFELIDASVRIGDVWRNRYDSLVLFSPRKYSALPGLAMSGNQKGFPTKDELADYLESYANYFSIPVSLHTKVEKLEKMDFKFSVKTSKGEWTANKVVIATGPFQKPNIPIVKGELSKSVFQIHSSEYQRPSVLPAGNVLVIGAGNSGSQIVAELSKNRKVYISTGHEIVIIPQQILKKSIFWWLDTFGISKVPVDSKLASYLQKTEPVIGMELKKLIEGRHVQVKERTVSFQGKEATFRDGTKLKVDNIIWATGFQFDYSWIDIPGVVDQQKKPIHYRGISPINGIYFLGLPWLSRVGSAQLNGIDYDAKRLYNHLKKVN
ncbi:flavin-containing monooxygenase [Metabacillus herbersteinensis]|uniref:Flavin-containing monooxygenase n=1 Tax=Metabacillus herbersteinensis TaxID=283816 RepID=A0ABV6GMW6_9BACI